MWKEKINMEFFSQLHRNLPQTKMWKVFPYQNTILKFVQLKFEKGLQHSTGEEE